MTPIPGFEGLYAVTRSGKVWSFPKPGGSLKGKWLTAFKHYKGYSVHYLYGPLGIGNRHRKIMMTHKIVALAYIPNPLGLKEINHKNCIKTDNRVSNLEWCTRKENMQHALKKGVLVIKHGSEHGSAKLTESSVLEIREKYLTGLYSQRKLASDYSVNQALVWLILHRKIWKHI